MTTPTPPEEQKGLIGWIEYRLPIFSFLKHTLKDYPAPKNLNYLWNFGSLAGITLVIMILTGLFLAMNYTPHADHAFASVERIMRDVNYGWLLRYIHMNGASMFFIVVYIHMFRGLYYGSYKKPRELLWMIGVIILLMMMATAFLGYVLPWGQMSFWGATVITNLFSAIPVVGDSIVTWLWGGYSVDNPTLNRFFVIHYLLPLVMVAVVVIHIWALHQHGSNNPLGIERKKPSDSIPFHPYYTYKDLFGLGVFLSFFAFFVFFAPNFFGEPDNYMEANPLVTPPHIVPEWYFLPFYAILRSVPSKLGGVFLMFSAVFILLVLPWIDRVPVRSARYRPWYKKLYWLFVLDCLVLCWIGGKAPEGMYVLIGRIATAYYFVHFLMILPFLNRFEPTLPVPESFDAAAALKKMLIVMVGALSISGAVSAGGDVHQPPKHHWSFKDFFGTFDRAELQRGYQVYREVCGACHGLKFLSYRNLQALGFSEAEVKALAAPDDVTDGPNDEGNMYQRPSRPSDRILGPYANEKAARAANNGALPPDLSLIVKARPNGADYVYALLTGYEQPPADVKVMPGMHYNPYFAGGQIAMAQALNEGVVTYADGTPATTAQMAHDVVAFLAWSAEPELEARKRMGIKVLIFLMLFTGLLYAVMRRVWVDVR